MPLMLLSFLSGGKSILSAIFTFFSKPPGAYVGIALAFLIALWWFGQHEFNKGAASVKAKQAQQVVRIIARQAEITNSIQIEFARVKANDETATNKRVADVPIHVTPQADAACVIDLGFIRVWNDAAHGPVPDAAAGADEAASGVALSTVARTAVENDGQFDQIAHQLMALQDWIRQQGAAR